MTFLRISVIVVLAAGPLFPACAVRTPDTVHTEKQSSREARIDALLQDYRRSIEELNAGAAAAGASGRADLTAALDDLAGNHRAAVEGLAKLRAATNTAWGNVNDELQASLDRLKQAYERTRDLLPPARPGRGNAQAAP